MGTEHELVQRLEALFGKVWQAALDRADILSRRRLRDLGGGDEAPGAIEAIVELLEMTSPTEWPPRWQGFGKLSETCPNLVLFQDRLIDGKIPYEDAVVVWDFIKTAPDQVSGVGNFAVGIMPKGGFSNMERDDIRRTRWINWMRQWHNAHGLPLVSGALRSGGATPEGILATAVATGALTGFGLERAVEHLESHIQGFSRHRLQSFVEQLENESNADEED